MKIDDDIKRDFKGFWLFWDELICYAKSIAKKDKSGTVLYPSNMMMIAAYAAFIWSETKKQRGDEELKEWHKYVMKLTKGKKNQ